MVLLGGEEAGRASCGSGKPHKQVKSLLRTIDDQLGKVYLFMVAAAGHIGIDQIRDEK